MSRRAAEKEIAEGAFTINGVTAKIGDRVDPENDVIEYRGRRLTKESGERQYLMLNKPKGVVTTMSDEKGRKTVADIVSGNGRVYPVGRLDIDSEGLLLLTDDGDFAFNMTHPSRSIRKQYLVTVNRGLSDSELNRLRNVSELDGEPIRRFGVKLLERNETATRMMFTLYEGKNREIRRICASLELTVVSLKRVGFGPLALGDLRLGEIRPLTDKEVEDCKKIYGSVENGEQD